MRIFRVFLSSTRNVHILRLKIHTCFNFIAKRIQISSQGKRFPESCWVLSSMVLPDNLSSTECVRSLRCSDCSGLSDGESLNISSEKPERKFLAIVVSLNNHLRDSTLESCGQLPLKASYFFDNCLVSFVTHITGRP